MKVRGRAALDQVAGHGEGRAGESDEGHAELPGQEPHRLEHVAGVGLGIEGAQPLQVLLAAGTGSATTGPVPGATSTPKPMAATGTTMSEKRMAASTP